MSAAPGRTRVAAAMIAAALACSPHDPASPAGGALDPCGTVDPATAATDLDMDRLCAPPIVRFARGSAVLDDAATCPLTQVAACATALDRHVFIEAHAARDEVATEEAAVLLADRRAAAVRELLEARGVAPERAHVLTKGTLEASARYDPREQRVALSWADGDWAVWTPATADEPRPFPSPRR
ncbi:MAG: OmpA family protein [Nannocystaceae bacterium]